MYRYHYDFTARCHDMDELWVPSEFSRRVLVESGGQLGIATEVDDGGGLRGEKGQGVTLWGETG